MSYLPELFEAKDYATAIKVRLSLHRIHALFRRMQDVSIERFNRKISLTRSSAGLGQHG